MVSSRNVPHANLTPVSMFVEAFSCQGPGHHRGGGHGVHPVFDDKSRRAEKVPAGHDSVMLLPGGQKPPAPQTSHAVSASWTVLQHGAAAGWTAGAQSFEVSSFMRLIPDGAAAAGLAARAFAGFFSGRPTSFLMPRRSSSCANL